MCAIHNNLAVNFSPDFDGWTPLHAASHWNQKEACEILCENYCNMEIKNHVGQTAFDVADPDLVPHLNELKKKQANMQKDRPDITSLINRPAVPSITNTSSKPSNRRYRPVNNKGALYVSFRCQIFAIYAFLVS